MEVTMNKSKFRIVLAVLLALFVAVAWMPINTAYVNADEEAACTYLGPGMDAPVTITASDITAAAGEEQTFHMNDKEVKANFASLQDILAAKGVNSVGDCCIIYEDNDGGSPLSTSIKAEEANTLFFYLDNGQIRSAINNAPGYMWITGVDNIVSLNHTFDAETHLCTNGISSGKGKTEPCGVQEVYATYQGPGMEAPVVVTAGDVIAAGGEEQTLIMNGKTPTEVKANFASFQDILAAKGIDSVGDCSITFGQTGDLFSTIKAAEIDTLYFYIDNGKIRSAINNAPGWKWVSGVDAISSADHAFDAETHQCTNGISSGKGQTEPCGAADISSATVTPEKTSYTYSGTVFEPAVTVTLGDAILTAEDYDVAYANNKKPGTATITVTGKGNYGGTATAEFTINKAAQKITKVTPTSKTYKAKKKTKKLGKNYTFTLKATATPKSGGGKVTFTKANKAGASKITVAKSGKVTVKKGLKKGNYTVKVKASKAANTYYKAASKTVTVKIVVK